MESLIELVAASFARHGIECPANGSQFVSRRPRSSAVASELAAVPAAEPPLATKLPEHNYRKSSQGDPAP
jgi:hypothetical protein